MSFELFSQHSCQVYHRAPKLLGTKITLSMSFFSKKVVRSLRNELNVFSLFEYLDSVVSGRYDYNFSVQNGQS